LGKNCFNWEQLEPLLQVKPRYTSSPLISHPERIKIAIASDRAFNFYYQDNLDILEELGAEVVFWSPMIEESLPEGVRGLYFGGGFPEVFAQELSENKLALYAVKTAIQQGIPTYAECGGLMYLCDRLVDFSCQTWQMVGILPTTAVMSQSLTLGYRKTTALLDSCLLKAGNTICGHEFHRSALTHSPTDPLLAIKGFYESDSQLYEGWRFYNLHASYIHLHFGEHRSYLQRFLRNCANFNR
jgi:cobyrinic acid a,c-diamide synthase